MIIKQLNEEMKVHKLKNGLSLYVYNNPNFEGMYANYTVDFGSVDLNYVYEGDDYLDPQGIAHYLEHLMFAKGDDDYFDEFSANGASANAYTSFTQTSYIFSAASNYQSNLKTLIDMTQTLQLSSERVAEEYGVIKEEIEMYNSRPNFVLQNKLFENLCQTNYKNDIAGTLESINEITKSHINRLFNIFYNPSNAILFVAGNFEFDIISFVEECQVIQDNNNKMEHIRVDEDSTVNKELEIIESKVAENDQLMIGYKLPIAQSAKSAIIDDISFEILSQWIASDLNPAYIEAVNDGILNETFSGFNMLETNINSLIFKMQGSNYKEVSEYIQSQVATIDSEDIEILLHKKIGSEIKLFSYPRQVVEFCMDLLLRDYDIEHYFNVLYSITSEEIKQNIEKKTEAMATTSVVIKPVKEGV